MRLFYPRIRVLLIGLFIMSHLSQYVLAAGCGNPPANLNNIWNPKNLQSMAYALALLMVVIQGVRYIVADSAQERAEVKKGLIYIVIGLLVVQGYSIMMDLYCDIANVHY